jgi:hypothetical protein
VLQEREGAKRWYSVTAQAVVSTFGHNKNERKNLTKNAFCILNLLL